MVDVGLAELLAVLDVAACPDVDDEVEDFPVGIDALLWWRSVKGFRVGGGLLRGLGARGSIGISSLGARRRFSPWIPTSFRDRAP